MVDRNDTEVAQAVRVGLRWNTVVPDDRITVAVRNGWVTLGGNVESEYQRAAVSNAILYLQGVRGVTNTITVAPHVAAADVKATIEARHAAWAAPGVEEVDDRTAVTP